VLIAEDNPCDVSLLQYAFAALEIPCDWTVVADGDRLLAVLCGPDSSDRCAVPTLIVLDLHLPRRDGWEVIEELDKSGVASSIPIVLFTEYLSTSTAARPAHLPFATVALEKPSNLDGWVEVAREMLRAIGLGSVAARQPERHSRQAA
jgi:CheY-like chemotaxis protein